MRYALYHRDIASVRGHTPEKRIRELSPRYESAALLMHVVICAASLMHVVISNKAKSFCSVD
jgi:hypothetical protein